MIIGEDNANTFDNWVNYQELERMVRFVVVPRKGVDHNPKVDWFLKLPHIYLNNESDIIEISSTKVREGLKSKFRGMVQGMDPKVLKYIIENKLYQE
jgi:nicotinic acid mononucleotide adenylyltransferase